MAFGLAMNQTIAVTPIQRNPDGSAKLDAWGQPAYGAPVEYKCRVDEGSRLIVSHSGGNVESKSAVAEARILLGGLVSVSYDDKIAYTNELGETIERKPKQIDVKRNLAGKPLFTEVSL